MNFFDEQYRAMAVARSADARRTDYTRSLGREIRVLDLFGRKPEFLPASLASESIYVRPGELALYVDDPDQWTYAARAFHPNHSQVADVRRKGFCHRSLPSGFDWEKIARTWYTHPSSVQARNAQG
jgi:hypothetical protein